MTETPQRALELLDKLLAERPERVGHDFSAATRCLTAFRDQLISEWRRTGDPADQRRLTQVNAVLSVVVGGHYPIGAVQWPTIASARDAFARVLATG
jgi:formate dehydrogenase major subunit